MTILELEARTTPELEARRFPELVTSPEIKCRYIEDSALQSQFGKPWIWNEGGTSNNKDRVNHFITRKADLDSSIVTVGMFFRVGNKDINAKGVGDICSEVPHN